jgi:hypothetical protein
LLRLLGEACMRFGVGGRMCRGYRLRLWCGELSEWRCDGPARDLLVWPCPKAASKAILTTAGSNILTAKIWISQWRDMAGYTD